MLIDDVTVEISAGNGGDGVVRFTKLMMSQGPTGGNGGRGGDVVLEGVSDLGALRVFAHKKSVSAQRGQDGAQNTHHGSSGDDVIVRVPVGTIAHDLDSDVVHEITETGQRIIVAKGGNGGFGNYHFRSSRQTTPMRANQGREGYQCTLRLELKLIADVGFVGLPNVGKSSLLNELTNASSKVANYQFTTLEPHLGAYYGLILADIPGLIEGASEGKGLGHKFLRHIERTRMIFHFIAADSPNPMEDYETVRSELSTFNPALTQKDEWIVISRSDEIDESTLRKIEKDFAGLDSDVITSSILEDDGTKAVEKILQQILNQKTPTLTEQTE